MMYRAFIVLVFIAVIVGSVMLGGQQHEPVSTTTIDQAAAGLGYAARQARVIETGPDGHPLYTLTADLINEPPGATQIQLQQVHMDFRDSTGHDWTGRADNGVSDEDVAKVELSGNVHVSGTWAGSNTPANINTEKLSVDTREKTLTSADLVTMTTTAGRIQSKGLSVNLNDGLLHLESNVHGTYTP